MAKIHQSLDLSSPHSQGLFSREIVNFLVFPIQIFSSAIPHNQIKWDPRPWKGLSEANFGHASVLISLLPFRKMMYRCSSRFFTVNPSLIYEHAETTPSSHSGHNRLLALLRDMNIPQCSDMQLNIANWMKKVETDMRCSTKTEKKIVNYRHMIMPHGVLRYGQSKFSPQYEYMRLI